MNWIEDSAQEEANSWRTRMEADYDGHTIPGICSGTKKVMLWLEIQKKAAELYSMYKERAIIKALEEANTRMDELLEEVSKHV